MSDETYRIRWVIRGEMLIAAASREEADDKMARFSNKDLAETGERDTYEPVTEAEAKAADARFNAFLRGEVEDFLNGSRCEAPAQDRGLQAPRR